jgi:ribulose-bisphosphate carboxylase large chain
MAPTNTAPITATYRLHVPAAHAAQRAHVLALEQSIEMPLEAVTDPRVRDQVVARVLNVQTTQANEGELTVARIALAAETVGTADAGQLLNMLFGNCSLQSDVELCDLELPPQYAQAFGGPQHGIEGLRRLCGAHGRPLTCTALKPIGSTPEQLAALAATFAEGGIDLIKDDHGWADQASAGFKARVAACQRVLRADGGSRRTLYAPSVSGSALKMYDQVSYARDQGVRVFLIAPMIAGLANFHALTRAFPDVAFIAHPALAGNARIAPPVLLGKLFRLCGADATIFPNHGGRFTYPHATCHAIAGAARDPWHGLRATLPMPAGGMTVERVPELVRDYGCDTGLLIGGGLLTAREQLAERTRAFVAQVAEHARAVRTPSSHAR